MTVLPTGVVLANVTTPADAANAGTSSGMKNSAVPPAVPTGNAAIRSRASRRRYMRSVPRCWPRLPSANAVARNGLETTALRSTWVYALWTPRFTRYLVQWTEGWNARSARLGREPHVGDVLISAMSEGFEIDALSEPRGKVLDIGTPERLAEALARAT